MGKRKERKEKRKKRRKAGLGEVEVRKGNIRTD